MMQDAAVPENAATDNVGHVQADIAKYNSFMLEIRQRVDMAEPFGNAPRVPDDYYKVVCTLIFRLLMHTDSLYMLCRLRSSPANERNPISRFMGAN